MECVKHVILRQKITNIGTWKKESQKCQIKRNISYMYISGIQIHNPKLPLQKSNSNQPRYTDIYIYIHEIPWYKKAKIGIDQKLPAAVTECSKSTWFQPPTSPPIERRRCAATLVHANLRPHWPNSILSQIYKNPNQIKPSNPL